MIARELAAAKMTRAGRENLAEHPRAYGLHYDHEVLRRMDAVDATVRTVRDWAVVRAYEEGKE